MYCSIHHVPSFATAFRYRREVWARQTVALTRLKEPDSVRRRRALRRVDRELSKGNFKTALSLVKQLQGQPGGLRGFGAAKQVSRRILSLDELKLNGTETAHLRSLLDSIMDSITRGIQLPLLDEGSVLRLEDLMHGESYDSPIEDHQKCVQHEAGHFLVGYLLGVLPKRYTISSTQALREDTLTGGRVEFLGFEFLGEVDTANKSKKKVTKGKLCQRVSQRKISSKTLNRFLCVIVGGLAAEHLVFGYSKGLHSDVEKLDRVLKWLDFTEDEADSQVKWAALNTVLILGRHHEARSRLAEAMALGRSVGFCIDTIENTLNTREI